MSFGSFIRRLLGTIPLILGISVVLFSIIHLAPGSPLDFYADNPNVTREALEQMRVAFGLDKPVPEQYVRWLWAFLNGNWGISFRTGQPVLEVILERLPATLILSGSAFLLSLAIAIPIGVLAATRRYSKLDTFFTFVSFSGISIPVFWVGLMAQLVFAIWLGWLPAGGFQTVGNGSFMDVLTHMVMPVCILSFATIAGWSRYVRASLIDVIGQDYIRTARAKGQTPRKVIWRHAVRNALLPIVTVVALDIVQIVSGAVITETIFSWPGIGRLFVESMDGRDYPVLMGLMMISSFTMVAANFAADMLYAVIDPRVRLA
ncbi:ABC transporter permease [Microvirga antarctica]|uniref:ABC transporter permease n=1 Tax=Microvirga antarctica TaxID=2819233 RepID=UPI001B30C4C4|nr:ABC transporter permease [Microvirga antarctica]